MIQAIMKQMVGVLPPSFLNIQQDNADISEEYLTLRFSRSAWIEQKIEYECTNDIALLHQYNLLRRSYNVSDDVFDKQSEIIIAIIARTGRLCVGGCHLNYSMQDSGDLWAEISEFSVLPDYQNYTIIYELLSRAIEQAAKNKAQFIPKILQSKIKKEKSKKEIILEDA